MKKIIILLLSIFIGISSLYAGATVKEFFGKVKVKYAGETTWGEITVGMELPANAVVSTGFNSQVVLDLGNATLDVLPLTRMTVGEITESQNTIKTSLFLQGGKIKADVGKVEGKLNDFVIKSPVATASVRGTAFEFSGNTLTVIRGEVSFAPTKKEDQDGTPGSGEEEEEEEEEGGEDTEGTDAEPTPDAEPAGVAVKAGGQTQMSSPGAAPVPPAAMAVSKGTVSASTKPVVVKAPVSIKSDGPIVKAAAPVLTEVAKIVSATTLVTIKFVTE